jgi:hypothetical protein
LPGLWCLSQVSFSLPLLGCFLFIKFHWVSSQWAFLEFKYYLFIFYYY